MDNLQIFLEQIKVEMANQTKEIIAQMDEKLVPFSREMEQLKLENQELKSKISDLEKNRRANNIIIYGLKENEISSSHLLESVIEEIKKDLNITVTDRDINTIRRIGKLTLKNEKPRPILVSFVCNWQRNDILKNKKKLKDIHISEDYPKDVIRKRKELLPKLTEERKKGNYAIISYDKLIIRKGNPGMEKRKRDSSTSPAMYNQPRKQPATAKENRINAFDLMRGRSNSFSASLLSSTEQKQ
ncbi:hypothetical protein PYW08_015626 [Mythimna loreyi]|uniref:Uncharacterized protein n=2 Tax=Mythimna loreyi TaxID=667449 RepID=A0ACC2QVF1_9NEOP|nr:hypothetical protein PYW08_015166 [Mythimna loreyi]KAJ8727229.1 hypothetical protein PYW08_015626 [Mythimna loreyi]